MNVVRAMAQLVDVEAALTVKCAALQTLAKVRPCRLGTGIDITGKA
jgi:hypothetical protein